MKKALLALIAFAALSPYAAAQTSGYTYERMTVFGSAARSIPRAAEVPDVTPEVDPVPAPVPVPAPCPPCPPCPITAGLPLGAGAYGYSFRSASATGYGAPLGIADPCPAPVGLPFATRYGYGGTRFAPAPIYYGTRLGFADPGFRTVYHERSFRDFHPTRGFPTHYGTGAGFRSGTEFRGFTTLPPQFAPVPSTFNFQKGFLGGTRVSASGDPAAIAAAAAAAQGAAGRRSFLPFGGRR